jgi:hypothetical protein
VLIDRTTLFFCSASTRFSCDFEEGRHLYKNDGEIGASLQPIIFLISFCLWLFQIKKLVMVFKWVPCHHGMARPQVADGGGLQIWRVAVNTLSKQSQTADKGWPTSLGVELGANNSPP